MEVILLERIEKLGQMGDLVRVKPGFARNFLLPQKKAVRATDANRNRFDEQRAQLEATNLERRTEAQAVASKIDGLAVTLIRQAGEGGQLYGSVNARDVSEAVTAAGCTIGRQQVRLNQPIKTLGLHGVIVNLHPEVPINVTVNVARSQEQADLQAKTGAAITRETGRQSAPPSEQIDEMFEPDAIDDTENELMAALKAAEEGR